MKVYDTIKELASKRKISIAELERTLDISNGSISKWNVSHPNSGPLQKVADYFNVSTDYLLGRTDNPKVNNGDSSNDEENLLIAAHIRDGLSEEEKEEVMQYIEFLKSKHSN